MIELYLMYNILGFPGGSDSKEICLQCGRPGFDPWVGRIPWRWTWQLTAVFLPIFNPLHWQYSSPTEDPGRLQFMGLQRVRHDWITKHSTQQMNWWRWIVVVCPGILLVGINLNVLYFLWESEEFLYISFWFICSHQITSLYFGNRNKNTL